MFFEGSSFITPYRYHFISATQHLSIPNDSFLKMSLKYLKRGISYTVHGDLGRCTLKLSKQFHTLKSCLRSMLVPLFLQVCHCALFFCLSAFFWLLLTNPLPCIQIFITLIDRFSHSLLSCISQDQSLSSLEPQEMMMHPC